LAGFISDECDRQKHCNGIVVLSGWSVQTDVLILQIETKRNGP
jgi:hypothetical protein